LKSEDFRLYVGKIVDSILEKGIRKAVIIIDNAPAHCKAEEQLEAKLTDINRQDFDDILLLRLAPYSHSLNPIENYWSSFKSRVKDIMRERREEINNDTLRQDGESLASKRMRILEETAQNAAMDSARAETFNACFNHLFTHLPKALREEDMPIGE
jgi:transposase